MNLKRARRILKTVWGCGESISYNDAKEIEAFALPGESALDTVARLAEVSVAGVKPFDCDSIYAIVSRAEAYRKEE